MGKGSFADQLLKIAEEHRIPFYEDESLSQLLNKLEIDRDIPPQLYTLVAEILAFVYQLDTFKKKRAKT